MNRVLVVEDHPRMVEMIVGVLARAGIAADVACTAAQADACVAAMRYGAIVLDRGLPDGDGIGWLRRRRAHATDTPCLVLTARDALHDRVDGLEAGADDYLVKPFAADELIARVRALLRRPPAWRESVARFGDLQVDSTTSRLVTSSASVPLSASELQLLLALVQAEGRVVRRGTLEAAAWGLSEPVTANALDVALHRLRRKLAAAQARVAIHNLKGVGYALGPVDDEPDP